MRVSRSAPVPRWIRIVNGLSLLLLLAGAAVYARAWFGMQGLRSYEAAPDAAPFAGMAQFNHFHELSRIGVWLVVAGVAVAVLAAIATALEQRRHD